MSKETEKLDAEIRRRFKVAGREEFVLDGKFKIRISDTFGQGEPQVEVADLTNVNAGIKPLEYLEPDVLKIIEDHFKHTSPETNPFMQDLAGGEDPLDENPFID